MSTVAGRSDQASELRQRRLTPPVLVSADDALRHARGTRELALGQASLYPSPSEQRGGVHADSP